MHSIGIVTAVMNNVRGSSNGFFTLNRPLLFIGLLAPLCSCGNVVADAHLTLQRIPSRAPDHC